MFSPALQDVIPPGSRSSFSTRRAQNGVWEVSRYDRRPGNMVTEDLDVLVVVLRSLIDLADFTATQENVRALMNEGEERIVRISAVPACGFTEDP